MKKLLALIMLMMISPFFSCDDDSDKNEINPAALFFLMGHETLTINATYNGGYALDGTRPGSGYLYVCLFRSLGPNTTSPAPAKVATNSVVVTDSTTQTITVTGIWPGNYYVMVFFDYRAPAELGDDPIQQNERYLLYNTTTGSNCTANATPVNVPETPSIDITFNDTYRLDSGGGGGGGPAFDTTSCL